MVTTAPAGLVDLSPDELRSRLGEALDVYVSAMGYPPGTVGQRRPMWLEHALRPGWRCTAVLDSAQALLGIAYGYPGAAGQWWYQEVRRGLVRGVPGHAIRWLSDYFELTELHVRPDAQGRGLGEALLRRLLAGVGSARVLLSTPEPPTAGTTRAWRLYRRTGFTDVLRDYRFSGDPRPFAVLGRDLPLQELPER